MEAHKNYKKEWILPANFPDTNIVRAFYTPNVGFL
jgi:hypothetical protein